MLTKLTLTVEETVIAKAKVFAKQSGRSLSELVENYLETITDESSHHELSPKLKKLVGSVRLPEDFNEEKERRAAVENKHLLG